MVFIPVAVRNTITVRGKAWKGVCCESCGAGYAYIVHCQGSGSGVNFLLLDESGAKERAKNDAVAALQSALERAVVDVPCPACGWYQREMIAVARRRHNRWMAEYSGRIALWLVALIPLTGLFYFVASRTPPWLVVLYGVTGVLCVTALGLRLAKFATSVHYDPNADDVEQRIRRGREYGILRADLEKKLGEEAREPPGKGDGPSGVEDHIREGRS
jgi:hypothetical protein